MSLESGGWTQGREWKGVSASCRHPDNEVTGRPWVAARNTGSVDFLGATRRVDVDRASGTCQGF
jgi:hypothetical protein